MLGRNGYFDPKKAFVAKRDDGLVDVMIYSKRIGPHHAAIEIRGDSPSIYDLLQRICAAVVNVSADKGTRIAIPVGTPKIAFPDGSKKTRVIRTQMNREG
jgi:hypothetical protein